MQSVTTGSVADKEGIKAGDIIHKVEDILIATDGTMKDYCDILKSHDITDQLKIMVYRVGTDEIMEGTLNGDKLQATGYAGIAGQTTDNGGTTTDQPPSNEAFRTEQFDGDLTWWNWYTLYGNPDAVNVYEDKGNIVFDITDKDTYVYLFYEEYYYDDVHLQVSTENRGVNSQNVSMVCRYDENAGFYEFSIGSDGLYQIWRYDGAAGEGEYTAIATGGSTSIRTGKEINVYDVSCKGDRLTLWINGKETNSVRDRTFTEGLIGIWRLR